MRRTVKLKNVELWIKTRSPLLITPSMKYLITSLIRLKMGDCFMEIKWPQRKTNSWELRIHNNTSSFNCKEKFPGNNAHTCVRCFQKLRVKKLLRNIYNMRVKMPR